MKKHIVFRYLIIVSIGMFIISCNKDDVVSSTHVIGAYNGTLTTNLGSGSNTQDNSKSATSIVTTIGKKIEVYCYNDDFSATVLLNIYENGDYMMTCLSGDEFESMYGHSLSQENMVGYIQNSNLQWTQHLNLEHIETDKHYGSFDMLNNSFSYTFFIDGIEYYFEGEKEYKEVDINF